MRVASKQSRGQWSSTPTHWAVDGIDAMTRRGLPLQAALLPVAALLGFTLLSYVVALARFRWEE